MFNPNISVQMGSLHEEDDDFSVELPAAEITRRSPKVLHKAQCSERSDSGYSECSSCSASCGPLQQCQCMTKDIDQTDHVNISENELMPATPELSTSLPHDLLKMKLEEIAQQAETNIEEAKLELVVPKTPELDQNQNELKIFEPMTQDYQKIDVVEDDRQETVISPISRETTSPAKTSMIMSSDFTNTIKMRKKSLENSLLKEKPKPMQKPPTLDKSGKVSMLKNKFLQNQVSKETMTRGAAAYVKSKDCMDVLKLKRKVLNDACILKCNAWSIFFK